MLAYRLIERKRDGGRIEPGEWRALVLAYAAGHVPRAVSAPLGPGLGEQVAGLDPEGETAVICAGGYRSSAATSLLRPLGFRRLLNVTGGTAAWTGAGYPVE